MINISTYASITGILGALLLALNINMFIVAYSLFLISSSLWCIFALNIKNNDLLTMNIVFSIINIIGLIRFS